MDYSSLKLLKIHTLFGLNDEVVALNTISMTDKFFVIGSSDNHLKIWSLDFKTVLMDASKFDQSLNLRFIITPDVKDSFVMITIL